MEKMVIGAVRGTPATAPSRTEKLQTRIRSSTPRPNQPVEFSSEGLPTAYSSGSESYADMSMLQDVSDFPNPVESDSPTEMALISQTFGKTASGNSPPVAQWRRPQDSSEEGAESAERSSLDVTLSEVRDRSPNRKSRQGVLATKPVKIKRVPKRGVSMREEFFSKIGWTRSRGSSPQSSMVWCHMC